jgi:hypothetical protein
VKHPRRIRLDFAVPVHRAPVAGAVLCLLGIAAAVAVGVAFQGVLAERHRLDAALETVSRPKRAMSPSDSKSAEEVASIERELGIPWSKLLSELELATNDLSSKVALLAVEPDPSKRSVRITAEARSLPDALAYLERLQGSKVLRYPMLESHERRKDDPEHPIRVTLSAEWRT